VLEFSKMCEDLPKAAIEYRLIVALVLVSRYSQTLQLLHKLSILLVFDSLLVDLLLRQKSAKECLLCTADHILNSFVSD
jgi:hypothetical protein